MSAPTVAPYGTWSSPIGAEMLASSAVGLSEPSLRDGVGYWLESRPTEGGRSVLMAGDPFSSPREITPAGFDVRTTVHEYGGGAYVVDRGAVFFSNFADQRLHRQGPGGTPVPITPETDGSERFADGGVTPDGRWWIGVRERHPSSRIADVVNELVAVPTDGSTEPRTIAGGRDFYAAPRVSPDRSKLSFLAWDLPSMPWDGCELFVAALSADAELGEPSLLAGRDSAESIWQPEWGPQGDLVFAGDRGGWWNLERIDPSGERAVLCPAEAEFGYPAWTLGARSFGFLGDGRIACAYDRGGFTRFAVLDPVSGELMDLDLPYDAWFRDEPALATEGSAILLVAASATLPNQVVWLDFATRDAEVLSVSLRAPVDTSLFSIPRSIEFPTEGDLTAHALFYEPHNPDFAAPVGEQPPLIVVAHGGPTGNTTPAFDLVQQFWTSRGFAVVDVNYGGSTGYGRAYRERLNGNWGVVDLHDCVNAARWLADRGEVDGERLIIRGGSAGGYTTICALTWTDVFAAGTSYFGIADLEMLAEGDTHKFEARYEHTLVGPWPGAADTYRARSPIHSVEQLSTPMLVLQGEDDKVVPPSQAELIVEALRTKGVPHAYLLFPGEGHGFRKAETLIAARQAELSFYGQILGFRPAGDVPELDIVGS